MSAPRIELHIEELVLHGFPPGDRARIADAIERGLADQLREQIREHGVGAALSHHRRSTFLDGGSFRVATGARPQAVGAAAATSVAKALHGGKR